MFWWKEVSRSSNKKIIYYWPGCVRNTAKSIYLLNLSGTLFYLSGSQLVVILYCKGHLITSEDNVFFLINSFYWNITWRVQKCINQTCRVDKFLWSEYIQVTSIRLSKRIEQHPRNFPWNSPTDDNFDYDFGCVCMCAIGVEQKEEHPAVYR